MGNTGIERLRTRALTVALAVFALSVAEVGIVSPDASADTVVQYSVTEGVSGRQSPTAAPSPAYGVPGGGLINVQCQVIGEPVGPRGNDLYFWATYDGRQLYVPDTWTDSPHLAGEPPIAGIPMCTADPASAATATSQSTGLPGGVSCYGDYCSGQDPKASGCAADATTVDAVDVYDGRLSLRWSPTCKTNWATYEQYPAGDFVSGDEAPLAISAVQDTGYTQTNDFSNGVGDVAPVGTSWTPMIYSPQHLVYATLQYPCGGMTLTEAAGDCLLSGLEAPRTQAR